MQAIYSQPSTAPPAPFGLERAQISWWNFVQTFYTFWDGAALRLFFPEDLRRGMKRYFANERLEERFWSTFSYQLALAEQSGEHQNPQAVRVLLTSGQPRSPLAQWFTPARRSQHLVAVEITHPQLQEQLRYNTFCLDWEHTAQQYGQLGRILFELPSTVLWDGCENHPGHVVDV